MQPFLNPVPSHPARISEPSLRPGKLLACTRVAPATLVTIILPSDRLVMPSNKSLAVKRHSHTDIQRGRSITFLLNPFLGMTRKKKPW